nr:phosphopantothenoylcysteine decarboxylase [Paludibacteraceae bacterium]
ADYRPANPSDTKIKRGAPQDNFQLSTFNFQLVENPDIAATLGGMKREDQTLVGFALETNDEEANARKKLEKKHLDMIVLNSLRHEGAAFGCDTNIVTIFRKNGERLDLPKMPKTDVAKHILDLI